jgi:lysophospholipase L1-like esterase
MSSPRKRQLLLALVTVVTVGSTVLVATANAHVKTEEPEAWVASWATAAVPAGAGKSKAGFNNQTVRMILHTSVGGSKVRIHLSNRYGTEPLMIGHATVALPWLAAGPGDLKPGSVKDLTFSGRRETTIQPGGTAVSDAVDMDVPWAGDVAVSLFMPKPTGPTTWHIFAKETSYVGAGDNTDSASGAAMPEARTNFYYLTGIDVLNRTGEGAIAVLGDSITDSVRSTTNANHRWPDYLSKRLNTDIKDGHVPGVLNLGVAGNRLTEDGVQFGFPEFGLNGSARLVDQVLAQTNVETVIIALGINDIWISKRDSGTIIAAIQQLAAVAHAHGVRVLVATIMPWGGFEFVAGKPNYTPELDSVRLAVNSYIRTTSEIDGVVDFDMTMRNPADPTKLKPIWDSGDHIHPNDIGNEIMANAIPLDVLMGTSS